MCINWTEIKIRIKSKQPVSTDILQKKTWISACVLSLGYVGTNVTNITKLYLHIIVSILLLPHVPREKFFFHVIVGTMMEGMCNNRWYGMRCCLRFLDKYSETRKNTIWQNAILFFFLLFLFAPGRVFSGRDKRKLIPDLAACIYMPILCKWEHIEIV